VSFNSKLAIEYFVDVWKLLDGRFLCQRCLVAPIIGSASSNKYVWINFKSNQKERNEVAMVFPTQLHNPNGLNIQNFSVNNLNIQKCVVVHAIKKG
jgi:hypothetical protein